MTAADLGGLLLAAGNQQYRRGDLPDAVRQWAKAAEHGEPQAMINLGFAAYEVGNPPEGQVWYERATGLTGNAAVESVLALTAKAAEAGNADALTRLGVQFTRSGGTTAADGFLRKAADQGHVHALWWLALLHGPTTPAGFDWFSKAHDARHPQAIALIRSFRESGAADG